jgi:pentatricopeptide repeat protein
MASLCKHGRTKEAAEIFDSMTAKGHKPNIITYGALLHGYASEGCFADMVNLFNSMVS